MFDLLSSQWKVVGTCGFFLGALAGVFASEEGGIVRNGHFDAEKQEEITADWVLPEGAGWFWGNADGYAKQGALIFQSSKSEQRGKVTQDLALPSGRLVLTAKLKSSAGVQPVVNLRWADGSVELLARIEGQSEDKGWKGYQIDFDAKTGGAAVLEIAVPEGATAPASDASAAVDDVQIVRFEEMPVAEEAPPEGGQDGNLAFGKRYVSRALPNYPHSTDPGDETQLTDGKYSEGYFWTQKSTVGWIRVPEVEFTIDLGSDQPIRGVTFNSAAGTAGVKWPISIQILVSTDGRHFHSVGDLMELSGGEAVAPSSYAIYRFETEDLETHGRYVKFLIEANGTTVFVDEVEILRGEDEWLTAALPGEGVDYGPIYFEAPFSSSVKGRLGTDLETVKDYLQTSKLPESERSRLNSEAENLEKTILETPPYDVSGFVGVYPFNALHGQIYALLGALRSAEGLPAVTVWSANPWNPLAPTDVAPADPQAEVSVAAMRGETRAGALNFSNNTPEERTLSFSLEGLPEGVNPSYVTVRELLWTDTSARQTVGSALPELVAEKGVYKIQLPAGMTRQLWFSVKVPADIAPGLHKGQLVVRAGETSLPEIPFQLRVFATQFPSSPRLHVTGWDYTDVDIYGNTPQNRKALVALLQKRGVDTPWATKGTLPYGTFDAEGKLVEDPDTASFDAWVALWPQAQAYHVFAYVKDEIDGTAMGTPLFDKKVASWIRFWVQHAASLGIPPEKLVLCLVDESKTEVEDAMIVAWAKVIRATEPRVRIFDTGTRPPERNTPELMAVIDIFCPHRPHLIAGKDGEEKEDPAFYRELSENGKSIFLYSCSEPGRTTDPYTYYRLQAWDCFDIGAEGSGFWSFSGNGGTDPWNEYLPASTVWTPLFLTKDDAITAKQMEAIGESVGDYEYLALLRDAVENLKQNEPGNPHLAQAEKLLKNATARVLEAPGAREFEWKETKDRSVAETVRLEIGEMLDKLMPQEKNATPSKS